MAKLGKDPQKKFIQFKGSPDIFRKDTGERLTEQEAKKFDLFTKEQGRLKNVETTQQTRPDLETEADFPRLAETDIQIMPKQQTRPDLETEAETDIQIMPKVPDRLNFEDFEADLQPLLERQKQLRQEQAETFQDTSRIQELKQRLTNVREEIVNQKTGIDEALTKAEQEAMQEGRETRFLRGEKALIKRQKQADLKNALLKEQNLIDSLGLEQEAKELRRKGIASQLEFLSDDINFKLKMQDRLKEQKQELRDRKQELEEKQKESLDNMIDFAEGSRWNELSETSRTRIFEAAQEANIPVELVRTQLDNIANENALEEDFFSDTQIAKGAEKAGMSISDFKRLSTDEQNKFIFGDEGDEGSDLTTYKITTENGEEVEVNANLSTIDGIKSFMSKTGLTKEEVKAQMTKPISKGGEGMSVSVADNLLENVEKETEETQLLEAPENYPETVGYVMNNLSKTQMDELFERAEDAGYKKLYEIPPIIGSKWDIVKRYIEGEYKTDFEVLLEKGTNKQTFITYVENVIK